MLTLAESFATSRPAEARSIVGNVFARHGLRLEGPKRQLAFRHTHLPLGAISFNHLAYGGDVEIAAPCLADFYLLQLTRTGRCEIRSRGASLALGRGRIAVMNPDRPYRKHWSDDAAQIILRIDRAIVETETGMRGRPVEFEFAAFDATSGYGPLARFMGYLEGEVADPAGAQAALRSAGPLARHLARLMLDAIPHTVRSRRATPGYVSRAEHIMRKRVAERLTARELANAVGISVRSLDEGFRIAHGLPCMQFLRNLRLDAAHDLLGHHPRAGVAETAAAVGLRHAGRFAAMYRRKFGEAPADYLRRL